MKVSDYIVRYLYQEGVRTVFELSGGMITHMLDSLSEFKKIQIVSMKHEQAAAFAADAMGRLTGIPGVALATSGPGAINLLTGIGSAFFDSSPALFITGQVNTNEIRAGNTNRQLGFQEADIVTMAWPVCKFAQRIMIPANVPSTLHVAFRMTKDKRPGSVLLDIPMDVQRADILPDYLKEEDSK